MTHVSVNTLFLLGVASHWKESRQVAVVTNDGTTGEVLSTSLFVANQEQRKVLTAEFLPSIIIDL